jgi:hypothetical protein
MILAIRVSISAYLPGVTNFMINRTGEGSGRRLSNALGNRFRRAFVTGRQPENKTGRGRTLIGYGPGPINSRKMLPGPF